MDVSWRSFLGCLSRSPRSKAVRIRNAACEMQGSDMFAFSSSKWFIVTLAHCFQSRVVWFPKKGSLPPDSGGGIHFGPSTVSLLLCSTLELPAFLLAFRPKSTIVQCCNVHPTNIKDRDCKLNCKSFSVLCLPGLCKMLSAWTIQAWQTSFTFWFVNQVEYFSPVFPTFNIYLGLN